VAAVVLGVGERAERVAQALDVAGVFEHLAALQEEFDGLVEAAEPQQRAVIVEPRPGGLGFGRAPRCHGRSGPGIEVQCLLPPAEAGGRYTAGV
jgi:hypothetical protein